jgi:hypothetical protein
LRGLFGDLCVHPDPRVFLETDRGLVLVGDTWGFDPAHTERSAQHLRHLDATVGLRHRPLLKKLNAVAWRNPDEFLLAPTASPRQLALPRPSAASAQPPSRHAAVLLQVPDPPPPRPPPFPPWRPPPGFWDTLAEAAVLLLATHGVSPEQALAAAAQSASGGTGGSSSNAQSIAAFGNSGGSGARAFFPAALEGVLGSGLRSGAGTWKAVADVASRGHHCGGGVCRGRGLGGRPRVRRGGQGATRQSGRSGRAPPGAAKLAPRGQPGSSRRGRGREGRGIGSERQQHRQPAWRRQQQPAEHVGRPFASPLVLVWRTFGAREP